MAEGAGPSSSGGDVRMRIRMPEPPTDVWSAVEQIAQILSEQSRHSHALPSANVEQWVHGVLEFSSQFNATTWAASMVIGEPRVFPNYGDIPGAWAQRAMGQFEHIVLLFAKPTLVREIHIYETLMPGAVVRVSAVPIPYIQPDAPLPTSAPRQADFMTLWEGESQLRELPATSRIFSPPLQSRVTSQIIRLDLDCRGSPSWCEIDAVKLVGNEVSSYYTCPVELAAAPPTEPTRLGKDLVSQLRDPTFSDVEFRVGDASFKAHRVVLAARSQYFAAMFRQGMAEAVVNVQDVHPKGFGGMLDFLYSGTLSLELGTLAYVYHCANRYNVSELEDLCVQEFRAKLQVATVLPLYSLVFDYFPALKDACLAFMCRLPAPVAELPELASLSQRQLYEAAVAFTGAKRPKIEP